MATPYPSVFAPFAAKFCLFTIFLLQRKIPRADTGTGHFFIGIYTKPLKVKKSINASTKTPIFRAMIAQSIQKAIPKDFTSSHQQEKASSADTIMLAKNSFSRIFTALKSSVNAPIIQQMQWNRTPTPQPITLALAQFTSQPY